MDDAHFDDYQQNYKTGVAEGGKTNSMNVGTKVQDLSAGVKLHGDAKSSSSSIAADNDVDADVEVDYGVLPEEPPTGKPPHTGDLHAPICVCACLFDYPLVVFILLSSCMITRFSMCLVSAIFEACRPHFT